MLQSLFKIFQRSYFALVLEKPWLTVLGVMLVAVLLFLQLPNLKIDASSDSLTLEYDKDLDYFREMSKRYQSGNFLVVTYKPDGDLFSDASLEHLKSLRESLSKIDGVKSVNSILDVPLLYSPKISLLNVATGINTLQDKGVNRELAAKEFIESPIYKNMLLGPDGKTTALLLNLDIDEKFIALVRQRDALRLKRETEGLSVIEQQQLEVVSQEFLDYRTAAAEISHQRVQVVRDTVNQYKAEAQIFLGGVSMITADMVDFIASDIVVFGIGIILFIVVILVIIFRRWQFVLLPLLTCLLSVVIMLGFLASIDWRLTIISSNFVALLLIVCLALTIHLIVRFREELSLQPDLDMAALLRKTVSAMFKPCMYTVMTTMVAFISLVVSGIRPVIDFGWMMTIGLLLAFVLAFLMIPAGFLLLPKVKLGASVASDRSGAFTLNFSRFTERNGTLILVAGVFAAVVSVVGISRLEVENRFIDYFHSTTEIHQGMLVIDQQLGGTITLDIVIDRKKPTENSLVNAITHDDFADASDPFTVSDVAEGGDPFAEDDPFGTSASDAFADSSSEKEPEKKSDPFKSYWFTKAGLEKISQLHNYLDSLPEVGKVQSLATAYQVGSDLNGRALNDFELALVRRLLPDDIADFLVKPYLSADIEQTRITARVKETDPNLKRAELLKKVKRYAIEDMGLEEEKVHITGVLVLYNNMLQSLFTSQILTISAVFFGILFMFLVLFRSLLLALIALIPNMLAALVVLGGMGIAGIPLDMMTITIAAIAVGIGVDNAIHYIYRFRHEFQQDNNYVQAMHRAHGSIGSAMYYTSITIIAGFSILALSKFIPSIYFGLLTGLAMLAAIVSSLTLLPKFLLLFKPWGPEA